MTTLLKRNMKLYFRDRISLLLSLLAIFIIIILYVVFLGNVWGTDATWNLPDEEVDILKYSWLTAGILAVATMTTAMGAFSVVVNDRAKKINKGFYASPVKRKHITGGYILSAFLIGVLMSLVTFVCLSLYIVFIVGGEPLAILSYLQVVGIILLSSLTNTAMVCFIVSFLKSYSAFSTVSTILGTLIGFLMGIYLPIGNLPETVQTVIKLFPPSHAAVLLRRVIMDIPMQLSFDGIPAEYLEDFQEVMGITYQLGDHEISPLVSVIVLLISAFVFYILARLNMRKMRMQN
ncbi:MAG: ABC transporter permease [Lachnospiraceae bacterium]|nr:ABC transporter permease [Lachnospiraceae bacterium]